jgi:hypothetical protein
MAKRSGERVSLLRQFPVSHVRVAPFIVNNNPKTMDRSRQSLPATAGRFRMDQAGMLPIGFVSPKCTARPRPHAEEHRSAHEHASRLASLRCDASRSMTVNALAHPHPSRRAHARSNLPNVFGMRAPQDEDEHRVVHCSRFQTAHLVPATYFLRPGFCTFCFAHPNRGVGGAPRDVRVLSGTPVGHAMTRHARRLRGALRPITRDARLSALHRGDFGLPGPRFSHRHLRRIGYSELLAPRS